MNIVDSAAQQNPLSNQTLAKYGYNTGNAPGVQGQSFQNQYPPLPQQIIQHPAVLTNMQRLRILEIAHDTKHDEVRLAALRLLDRP